MFLVPSDHVKKTSQSLYELNGNRCDLSLILVFENENFDVASC